VAQPASQFPCFGVKDWNVIKRIRAPEQRLHLHDLMRQAGLPD
jgi:hypothetical protein